MEEQKKVSGLKEVTREVIGWEDNKLIRTLNYLTTRPGKISISKLPAHVILHDIF